MADIEIPELRVGCDLRVERYRVEGRYDHPPLTREQAQEVKRRAELYPAYQKLRKVCEGIAEIPIGYSLSRKLKKALAEVEAAEAKDG